MTRLERLNQLLAEESNALGLPPHRREVTASFSNLGWLQKNVGKIKFSHELQTLLGLSQKELLKEA